MGRAKRQEKMKRARKEVQEESPYYIARKGVNWRRDRTRCVVEMRPPQWEMKLQFGSHGSKAEAMVARDYGAFLRVHAGESEPDAGGFDTTKLYYFEESPGIFESMGARTMERRASILVLYPQMAAGNWTGQSPHLQFCKLAREDIEAAIRLFRERYPQRFTADSPPMESSPSADLFPLAQVSVTVDGSPHRIVLEIQAPHLEDEHVHRIFRTCIKGFEAELKAASFEKVFHDAPPCTIDPLSIPAVDDPESKV